MPNVLVLSVAGLLTLAIVMGIGRFIYTPILPFMIEDQVLTYAQAGSLASSNFIGYLLGAYCASLSILGANRHLWLFVALTTSAATTFLMSTTESLLWFYPIRFISGIASAFAMIFISSIVMSEIAATGRKALLGVHFAGVGVGISASALFVPLYGNWQQQWAAGGYVSFIGLFLVAGLIWAASGIFRQQPADATLKQSSTSKMDNNRPDQQAVAMSIRALIISYGLFGFGYVITATFISELARSVPELNSVQDSVWLYVGVSGIFSALICNWLARYTGILGAYVIACLIEAVGVAISVLVVSPVALLTAAILLGGTFIGATALGLSGASILAGSLNTTRAHSDSARKIIALMTASFGLGQVVGPWIAGWMFEFQGNLTGASLIAVAALVLSAGLAMVSRRYHRV